MLLYGLYSSQTEGSTHSWTYRAAWYEAVRSLVVQPGWEEVLVLLPGSDIRMPFCSLAGRGVDGSGPYRQNVCTTSGPGGLDGSSSAISVHALVSEGTDPSAVVSARALNGQKCHHTPCTASPPVLTPHETAGYCTRHRECRYGNGQMCMEADPVDPRICHNPGAGFLRCDKLFGLGLPMRLREKGKEAGATAGFVAAVGPEVLRRDGLQHRNRWGLCLNFLRYPSTAVQNMAQYTVGPNRKPSETLREGSEYDLFVIGGGSGGVRAARYSARLGMPSYVSHSFWIVAARARGWSYWTGAKVALCELERGNIASEERGGTGGTCVLRGCVPKKLMAYAGRFTEDFLNAKGFGWHTSCDPVLDFRELMRNKQKETDRLSEMYLKGLKESGVDVVIGRGQLKDATTVSVNGRDYKARNILVATGSYPSVPPIEGAREHGITSDHVLYLQELPKTLVIVGGGYIACEQATIYNNLGSKVHLVIRQDLPLKGFDDECRNFALEQYRKGGVIVHTSCSPTKLEKCSDGSLCLHVEPAKGTPFTIDNVNQVLFATGRKPRSSGIGLERAGVELDDKGAVLVDKNSRSKSAATVWAVGDVTNRKPLTPAARMEGSCLAMHLFCDNHDDAAVPDHDNVASVVFSSPEVATVGLSEETARETCQAVDVFTSQFV
eukprot:jgi/Botrbrau1/11587/Bobra.247_1s0008.1